MSDDDRWAIVDEPTPAPSPDDLPPEVIDRRRVRAIALERRAHARRVVWRFAAAIVFTLACVDCIWRLAVRPMGTWQRLSIGLAAGFCSWMAYASFCRWRAAARMPPPRWSVATDERPDFAPLSDGRETVARLESMTGNRDER